MEHPKFIEKKYADRFEYHLPVTYQRFLSKRIFDNSEFRLDDDVKHDLFSFISQHNISSFIGWDENSILFTIALRRLAKQKKCFLIFFNNPAIAAKIQPDISCVKAEWWNSIQFIQGDVLCKSFGIQSPEAFLKSVNYSNQDLSNWYFYICEIDPASLDRYVQIYNSDVTNWFFIFTDDESEIMSTLTSKEQPTLDLLLKQSSALVNIQIGGDEGYLDYMLIQSKSDLSNLITDIENKQHSFVKAYEDLLSDCKPFDDEWKADLYKERMIEILQICG